MFWYNIDRVMHRKSRWVFGIIYACLALILAMVLVVVRVQTIKIVNDKQTPKPQTTPAETVLGELEIVTDVEPLKERWVVPKRRNFKKTTPQPASKGFNYNMYEYYEVNHVKHREYAGGYRESLSYNIRSKDNGLKVESHIYLKGNNFQPDNCGLYSFLESSNTIFIICRDNHTAEKHEGNYWILGFASLETGEYFNSRTMQMVLKEKIPAMRGDFSAFFEVSMSEVGSQKYYLVTDERMYRIGLDSLGTKLEMKEIPLKFYLVDDIEGGPHPITTTSKGWAIDLIYNQDGNLIIFTGINGGGIIDTDTDQSLKVDKSCIANISREQKDAENFYNDRVDPFTEGPYKSINGLEGQTNTYGQSVSNAGCVSREGRIRLYRKGDTGYCQIILQNEPLGC